MCTNAARDDVRERTHTDAERDNARDRTRVDARRDGERERPYTGLADHARARWT